MGQDLDENAVALHLHPPALPQAMAASLPSEELRSFLLISPVGDK